MLQIKIILGSTRPNRMSETVANWMKSELNTFEDVTFDFIDLKEVHLPFYDEGFSMAFSEGKEFSTPEVEAWHKRIADGDAYIIITPEYNHGYPAVLKNALDYAYKEWNRKPVAFVSYGSIAGGSRAVEQLRQVAVELQMAPTRFGVHIPNIWEAFENEAPKNPYIKQQLLTMTEDLMWWSHTLKHGRDSQQ